MTKKEKPATLELSPHQIIRKHEGAKYFGFRRTALDDKIKDGSIPQPIKLGARAVGWLGSQIIEWQRGLIENSK